VAASSISELIAAAPRPVSQNETYWKPTLTLVRRPASVIRPGVDALVDELAEHLRALLRDVLCGHLDADLRSLADRLLDDALAEPAPSAPVSSAGWADPGF